MYMEENRKRFLDKILRWFVEDTEVYSYVTYPSHSYVRTWLPTFLQHMVNYPVPLRPLDISNLSLFPIVRFYDYCRMTYDLSVEEIESLWNEYTVIILDKFNNEKPINESEDKLGRYYNYVIEDLIKRTKHWLNPGNPLHVGVTFPFYEDDTQFYYTEDEIKGWLRREWSVGGDDFKYLIDQYGLTKEECYSIMTTYGKKIATLLISEYGGQ